MSAPTPTVASAVREVLAANPKYAADQVIAAVTGKYPAFDPQRVREAVYNVRSALNAARKKGRGRTKPVTPVARVTEPIAAPTAPPTAAPRSPSVAGVVAKVEAALAPGADVDEVLDAVEAAGGVAGFRRAAELVRALGAG